MAERVVIHHDSDRAITPTSSSTDSLVVLHSNSMAEAATPARTPPVTAPLPSPDKVAVLDTRARGVGDGELTLEAMEHPPLADGGTEAVVGAAHGKEPEVIAVAEKDKEDKEDKTTMFDRIKQKLTPSSISDKTSSGERSRSTSILSRASRDDDAPETPSPVVNPLPAITKGVPEMEDPVPQPTKITTDATGKPVPVDVGPLPGSAAGGTGAPSLATSLRDDLSDQIELDPTTSASKFHSLFAGKIPEEEELIEGLFRDDEVERRGQEC